MRQMFYGQFPCAYFLRELFERNKCTRRRRLHSYRTPIIALSSPLSLLHRLNQSILNRRHATFAICFDSVLNLSSSVFRMQPRNAHNILQRTTNCQFSTSCKSGCYERIWYCMRMPLIALIYYGILYIHTPHPIISMGISHSVQVFRCSLIRQFLYCSR